MKSRVSHWSVEGALLLLRLRGDRGVEREEAGYGS